MNPIASLFVRASQRARARRAEMFRQHFGWIGPDTRLLDLGSENGSNIHRVLSGFNVSPANVHIADISATAVQSGHERFGFTPVTLGESERLPFEDGYFDLVFCSSVIEHVTVPKADVWRLKNGREFRTRAMARQRAFADEIRRVGRNYFVQTPNRYFPIESHTWLPFIAYLPRPVQLPILGVTNRVWVKSTAPDWNLLNENQMQSLFPEARITKELSCGLVKSLMAIKNRQGIDQDRRADVARTNSGATDLRSVQQ
jgi:SAM-dependent methyltransferase